MSIFSYDPHVNIRTRTIVLYRDYILLHPPQKNGGIWGIGTWGLPRGRLESGESLAECVRREVLEETGILVHVGRIAFMQEWLMPHNTNTLAPGEREGYSLESFHYATPEEPVLEPLPEKPGQPSARWVPIIDVPSLPIHPKELKALCQQIIKGQTPPGCPPFIGHVENPRRRAEVEGDAFV